MDNGVEWLPHTSAQPVKLPPISASAGGSSKGIGKAMSWNTVGKWLKGRETVMDIEVAPEDLEAWMKRWALKWHYFQEAFPETSQYDIDGMGRDEMRTRITWLEGEFTRISDQILHLQEHATNYEILAGSQFVTTLIQDCQPDLVSVLTTSKTNGNNSTLTEEERVALVNQVGKLKSLEKLHMFALRCVNEMTTLKQTLAARSKFNLPVAGTDPIPPSDLNTLRLALPDLRIPPQVAANVNRRNEPRPLISASSANLHMKNLTALLGIAFFGASITWSTIFSGTRGNLVLISWAACFFIVAAVGAAGASVLVMQDENLVATYLTVRWTVRILSLLAMVHVLAGMFLVAIAILVLDPGKVDIDDRGGRRGTESAGAYAISLSMVSFIVVGAVWRRYTRHTWFS
ncbi:hypothetical protein B0H13DRAFT_2499949 [Mycena leptocephala]|nr:hypothetical protein B0H13DRAFT_2499949 [Mycena leptocephala]